MTMMSNWSRSSRGGRVDVVMHCDDRISGLQRIRVVERCRLAREAWEGVVHLIDTCDIPCAFFVNVSLLSNAKALAIYIAMWHAYSCRLT